MELERIREDSESRIVFELSVIIRVYPSPIPCKISFRLAAETNTPAARAPQNGKKFSKFVDENTE
jgi:hypothetical protein